MANASEWATLAEAGRCPGRRGAQAAARLWARVAPSQSVCLPVCLAYHRALSGTPPSPRAPPAANRASLRRRGRRGGGEGAASCGAPETAL